MARRRSDAEATLASVVEEELPGIKAACKVYESHLTTWAHGKIIADVRDDGEWRRFAIHPRNAIDAAILGVE